MQWTPDLGPALTPYDFQRDDIERILNTGGDGFVVSDLLDPELNVRYGSWYLRNLLNRYDDDLRTALAAYHAGPGNVDAWRRKGVGIQFPETRAYVDRVLDAQEVYADAYADELGRP